MTPRLKLKKEMITQQSNDDSSTFRYEINRLFIDKNTKYTSFRLLQTVFYDALRRIGIATIELPSQKDT